MAVGDVVAGVYRVTGFLGRGGSSIVLQAFDIGRTTPVALKIFLDPCFAGAPGLERVRSTAQIVASLGSPHVVKPYDVGILPSGHTFITMELVAGTDLARLGRGPLQAHDAASLVIQACSALAEAHASGLVHGDIKPTNLLVAPRADGRTHLKITDFAGVNALIGSPGYASPEQLGTRREIDPRTDVWALGVVLYELVTGSSPFAAQTVEAMMFGVLHHDPHPMRSPWGALPSGFERVARRCLSRDRERRYPSASDLAAALLRFAGARPNPPLPSRSSSIPVAAPSRSAEYAMVRSDESRTIDNRGPVRVARGAPRAHWTIHVAVPVMGIALVFIIIFLTGGFSRIAFSKVAAAATAPPPVVSALPSASPSSAPAPPVTPSAEPTSLPPTKPAPTGKTKVGPRSKPRTAPAN